MAIRTRILIVVVALVAIALSVLDVISYTVVRRSLLSSADTQLQAATSKFRQALSPFSSGVGCYGLPVNSFGTLYYLDGQAAATVTCPSPVARSPIAHLPAPVVSAARHSSSSVVTSVTSSSGEQYRVVAELTKAERNGGSLYQQTVDVVFVVGEPLAPVDSTLANVALLEVVMSASVLVAVGAIAFFLVQLGLRPLETMSETAGEIAAGDLTRRVDDTDERTEVGRLGASLNVMLTRIEEAFRAKEASENQLRRFVADASHELRTPLTSIRGYAELF
ncbi:MAG TPA: HAMP domain-containing protein, partial [Acidimicrobiales bacterium]|nr:HAMP domain-containing protein [Acidimicrobiales bacterium]